MYYPLSQITPNLYANGGEFQIKSTGTPYTGYYFKTSTRQYFTGRNQNDNPVIEIIPYNASFTTDNTQTILPEVTTLRSPIYNSIKPIGTNQVFNPVYNPNIPTQQDYQIGEYRRYFCKKTNEIIYLEINQNTFDKLVLQSPDIYWQYYLPFFLPWNLTGVKEQVATVNRNIVLLTMKDLSLPQFDAYLNFDFIKYYV
jgi:hypothetical protein